MARPMPWMVVLALVGGSCGGGSTAVTEQQPSTTTTTLSTTTTHPECEAGEFPDAADLAWVLADPDGDRVEDRLVGYEVDGSAHLRVEFDGGGSVDVEVGDWAGPVPIEPIGGHDLDGDGDDELFATVGWGAYTFLVGVWSLHGCGLVRIDLDGIPVSFPVGASVSNVSGLWCPEAGGLEAVTASLADEDVYEGEIRRFELQGSGLVETDSVQVSFDGDEVSVVPTFECADFSMSAGP